MMPGWLVEVRLYLFCFYVILRLRVVGAVEARNKYEELNHTVDAQHDKDWDPGPFQAL